MHTNFGIDAKTRAGTTSRKPLCPVLSALKGEGGCRNAAEDDEKARDNPMVIKIKDED